MESYVKFKSFLSRFILTIKFVNVLVSSPCETEPKDKHVYYIVFCVVIVVNKTPARRSLITVDLA